MKKWLIGLANAAVHVSCKIGLLAIGYYVTNFASSVTSGHPVLQFGWNDVRLLSLVYGIGLIYGATQYALDNPVPFGEQLETTNELQQPRPTNPDNIIK